MVGIFGILDPLRPEVPAAVKVCQKAGVKIRMVTGDSVATARAIARDAGILTEGGTLMEGHVFRKLSPAEMDLVLPKLQVLARSSPLDKQVLVNRLKFLGETVAVTGDGTNDGPALKSADVGFSMGIAGTEVAKEASDIVLLDDNFASLVKAIIWGRSVYDSVRKFLQFQLTVNVVSFPSFYCPCEHILNASQSAVVLVFITSLYTAFTGDKIPTPGISAVQLLWVNLIMDTMAALALATDPPSPSLLERKPSPRSDPILNAPMKKMIVGQGIYQIIVGLVVYFLANSWFPNAALDIKGDIEFRSALLFNAFVFCQIFNEVNSRSISSGAF
jgi:Ca2+-transporting ATPase